METLKIVLNGVFANVFMQVLVLILTVISFLNNFFDIKYAMYIVVFSVAVFIFLYINEYIKYKKIYTEEVHIPIVLNFEMSKKAELMSVLNKIAKKSDNKISLEDLKKYLFIKEDELIYNYEGGIYERERIKNFFMFLKHDLAQLRKKLLNNSSVHYHIAIIGKGGHGFLAGVVFSDKNFTFYQYDKTKDDYNIKISIDNRDVFTPKEPECSEITDKKTDPSVETVDVILNFSSVSVSGNFENFVILNSKKKNLQNSDEFIECAREIYTVLNSIQKDGKKMRLYYSMPIGLAFVLGFFLKNYWDIELMQFDSGKNYVEFMNLKEINF